MRPRGTKTIHALVALGALFAVIASATPASADHDDDRHWRGHGHWKHRQHGYWDGGRSYYYSDRPSYYYYEPRRRYYYDAPRVYVPPPPAPSFGLNLVFPIH